MIVYEQDRKIAPLLGPQLARGGPFAPGDRVDFEVPISNERQVELERVKVAFRCSHPEARFDPETVEIPLLAGGASVRIKGGVVVPDLDVPTGSVRIWGVLQHPLVGALETAQAEVQVRSRAIVNVAFEDQTLVLENVGTATAVVHIDADVDLPSHWHNPVTVDPGARVFLALPLEPLGAIRCTEEATSERTVVLDRRRALQPALLSVEGRGPDKGVRVGDLLPVQIEILNSGGPAYQARVTLDLPSGVTLEQGYSTRNDVTLLDEDVHVEDGRVTFTLNCIEPNATAHLASAFRVRSLGSEVDVLVFRGEVHAGESSELFKFGVRATRLPSLAGHDTYWSPLEEDEQGFIHTSLTVTNVHGDAVDGTLALRTDGAQIESVSRDGRALELGSDAVEYGTLVDFGTLAARSRVTLDVVASRLPGRREVCFDARMVAHGRTMHLAQIVQELTAEPRATLTLRPQREPRVRVGMPCLLEVTLVNNGTDTLRRPRLRPVTPDGVEIHLPYKSDETGWCSLPGDLAPLGGRTGFPVILELKKPPVGDEIEVALDLDADNTPTTRSMMLQIATPSRPAIVVSEPELREIGKRGLVEVRVRVANRSDGVARDVWLTTRPEDQPVPYTATLDGHSVDERGRGGSILVEGLPLGDLPPNSQRDVAWYAAPSAQRYRTVITVHAEPHIQRVVDGGMEITDQAWFTTEPLPAQPVDENIPLAGVAAPTPSVLDVRVETPDAPALDASSGVRALGAAAAGTETLTGSELGTLARVAEGEIQDVDEQAELASSPAQSALAADREQSPADALSQQSREVAPKSQGEGGGLAALFDRIGLGGAQDGNSAKALPVDEQKAAAVLPESTASAEPQPEPEPGAPAVDAANAGVSVAESTEVPVETPVEAAVPAEAESAAPPAHAGPLESDPVVDAPQPVEEDGAQQQSFERNDDLGTGIVAMLHGLDAVAPLWQTALVQAVMMRLIGPHELVEERKTTVAGRVQGLLPFDISEEDVANWFIGLLAEWSYGAPSAHADEEAIGALQRCSVPKAHADVFDDYLAEVEEIFPLRGHESYLDQLRSTPVPRVADALTHLMEAIS